MLVLLELKVITNAKKNEVVGRMSDGTLKVRIKDKPIAGKANQTLLRFLSEELCIPKTDLRIVSGEKARRKRIEILDISQDEIFRTLLDQ